MAETKKRKEDELYGIGSGSTTGLSGNYGRVAAAPTAEKAETPAAVDTYTAPQYGAGAYADMLGFAAERNDAYNRLINRPAFSYDHEKDPTYLDYADVYTREGKRAMQDTLGEVSARTGGLASSYATTAAQQANNYYMEKMADKIPELRQLAYDMYMQEGDALRDAYDIANANYLNSVSRYNTDRSFDYGVQQDAYTRQQKADADAYDKAMDKASVLGAYGDFSGYGALGYTEDEQANMKKVWEQQNAPRATGGGGGGGGSKSSSTGNAGIIDTMLSFGDDIDAYEYLVGLGKTAGVTQQLWEMYQGEAGGGNSESGSVEAELDARKANGAKKGQLLSELRQALNYGAISEPEYWELYKKYV